MADEQTIRQIIKRAQDGAQLSPQEVERVTTWVRDDLGPAVRQMNHLLSTAFADTVKRIGETFATPAGQHLLTVAREYEQREMHSQE